MSSAKIPVILDTDIGDDIDDTWALAMLLNSPELDLKMVVTCTGETDRRAAIVARMLEAGSRADIPVAVGIRTDEKLGRQAPWIEGYELASYPGTVHENGVEAMIGMIMESAEPVTLICIGPLTNIGAALEWEPRIADKARFVGMHGAVRRGHIGSDKPCPEYNVRQDIAACRAAFSAPWEKIITPLDTCGQVQLVADEYYPVRDSDAPLAQAVIENYRIWAGPTEHDAEERSSILFDTVAVYLAYCDDTLEMDTMRIAVDDEGYTVESADGDEMSVAIEWRDMAAFKGHMVGRVTSA